MATVILEVIVEVLHVVLAEEEAADVSRNKLYRPAAKFNSTPPPVSLAHFPDAKKPVSYPVFLLDGAPSCRRSALTQNGCLFD